MKEAVAHRGGAHGDGLGAEHFCSHIVEVAFGQIKNLYGYRRILQLDAQSNPFSQFPGAVPHGVVDNGNLVFLIIRRPLDILLYDLQGVFPPDDPVAGGDHVDLQIQGKDLL